MNIVEDMKKEEVDIKNLLLIGNMALDGMF